MIIHMIKIMLACSTGMSTNLLVTKMEANAKEQNLETHIWAIPEANLSEEITKCDVVLLGPKVRYVLNMAFEAISKAKEGNIEEARKLLKESKAEVNKAHIRQIELIQQEACANKTDVSLVLIHAQDHLMNTINYQMLADKIIDIHKKFQSLEIK